MLKGLERLINRSPFYNLIRFNPLSDLIIEILHNKVGKAVQFYSQFLVKDNLNKLVFDIGANKGNKVLAFTKLGFKVVAVEPEKKSLSTLYWRFKSNAQVTIVEKGVSDKNGTLTIHVTEGRSGLNTLSEKWVGSLENTEENRWHKSHVYTNSYDVEVTTLENLMTQYGIPYYIKIDVEGFELNVINGMKRLPNYLSFETNLPEFLTDTLLILEKLYELQPNVTFNYSIEDNLVSQDWIKVDKMKSIASSGAIRYMEIIAKF